MGGAAYDEGAVDVEDEGLVLGQRRRGHGVTGKVSVVLDRNLQVCICLCRCGCAGYSSVFLPHGPSRCMEHKYRHFQEICGRRYCQASGRQPRALPALARRSRGTPHLARRESAQDNRDHLQWHLYPRRIPASVERRSPVYYKNVFRFRTPGGMMQV